MTNLNSAAEFSNQDLDFWLKRIEALHPAEIEMGLARIKKVADKLELLTLKGKVILVGGTNGKGSCVAALEAMALTNDLSVSCYTSPHLLTFNERIRFNGVAVSDKLLVSAFEKIEVARGEIALTFFEFTTLAALYLIKQSACDLTVLEVGLGGRLDAVNIVEPDVSIITTIALDHSEWLGDSLESVAFEKAGIARENKLALTGDKRSFELLSQVESMDKVDLYLIKGANKEELAAIENPQVNPRQLLEVNLILAKAAFSHIFPEFKLELSSILTGIHITGRFQQLDTPIKTLLDVGHNPQAAKNLADQLNNYCQQNGIKKVYAICGMMADKAIDGVLAELVPIINEWCFTDLPMARAISAKALAAICQKQLLVDSSETAIKCFDSVATAYGYAAQEAEADSLILVFGSFITVANMLQYLQRS